MGIENEKKISKMDNSYTINCDSNDRSDHDYTGNEYGRDY